jgi:predicted DNA-binding WGR domain protein
MNIIQFKNRVKRRFYQFIIKQENQQWVLIRNWGGLDNNIGHNKQELFYNYNDCEKTLKRYINTRVKRGYELLK